MFDAIKKAVIKENKKLTIHRGTLTYQSFDEILGKNPRVLIIMCHGMLEKDKLGNENCCFCFENEEYPFLIDKCFEDRLINTLKTNRYNIDVIVLSTCHSARLGKMLVKHISPSPAVIAINTTDQIAQSSTFKFNQKFLKSLIMQNTVRDAFEQAKALVSSMPKDENRSCCCNHDHTEHCLFYETVKRDFNGNLDLACQALHQDECDCYVALKSQHEAKKKGQDGTI